MDAYIKVTCPKCQVVLLVDRFSGEVIETRDALIADTTGDRFQDAMQKVKRSAQENEQKFEQSKHAEKNRKQELENLFKKSLDQVKKEGPVEKGIKDIDLD
jgi:hypothetical protein